MKSVLISCDYKYPGGYFVIANGIAELLASKGVDVTILGRGWDQSEHHHPFRVVPTDGSYIPMHTASIARELKPDWVLLMMDVPRIVSIFDNILIHNPDFASAFKCGAIFPVESHPMGSEKWVSGLRRFAVRFTFTEYGMAECKEVDLPTHRLRVGVDPSWYAPPSELPIFKFDFPYVLMVAENQIRKNQPGAYSMVRVAGKRLVLVTEENNPDGWDLRYLAKQCQLDDGQAIVINKSMVSKEQLKHLYRGAESVLLPSIAEGIGLPLYEAQAQGCPVVATDCCGITEAVVDKSALIQVSNITPYPWGNTYHYWPSITDGAAKLKAAEGCARQVIEFQPWSLAGEQLHRVLSVFEQVVESVK